MSSKSGGIMEGASRRVTPGIPVGNNDYTQASVVIIGAGISGMCLAIDLLTKYHIRNFVILEKSGGFGGTWRDNKFPGCCCDVWSHLYCFSFDQNPNWTKEYPGQEEILDYLTDVAQKYGLYRYARFDTAVESARWDEEAGTWKTSVKVEGRKDSEFISEYTIESDYLVSAVGQLNVPHTPNIPGINDFEGKLMHSARWDWSYPLDGKRIAIIGTGATAAQIVPEIAPRAKHLSVLQRSPGWVIDRHDGPVPAWKRALFRYFPPLKWRYRAVCMDIRELFFHAVTQQDSIWAKRMADMNYNLMRRQLPNQPEMWKKLSPNYPPGCKRSVISDDYYPALGRPNVTLETHHIKEITKNGIRFEDEDDAMEEFDLIILATGFKSLDFMHPIKISGRHGRPIQDIWKGGVARAFKGVIVEDLPNFAMLYGPNTNLSHNSLILPIEAASRYISVVIDTVLKARARGKTLTLTPKPDRVASYNEQVQKTLSETSFANPNCTSWWKTADGAIPNNWPGTAIQYQELMSMVDWDDFECQGTGSDDIIGKPPTFIGRVVEETQISARTMLAVGGMTVVGIVTYGYFHLGLLPLSLFGN